MNLVTKSREMDNPTLIESDLEALTTRAEEFDSPALIEKTRYDRFTQRVNQIEDALSDVLMETSDLSEKTVDALDFDALWDEFHGDDDDVDIAVLTQNPEVEAVTEAEEPAGVEALSDAERAEAKAAAGRVEYWTGKNDTIADAEKEALADIVGVESADEIDMEAI